MFEIFLIHIHSTGCIELEGDPWPELSGYIRLNDSILDHILLSGVTEEVNFYSIDHNGLAIKQ